MGGGKDVTRLLAAKGCPRADHLSMHMLVTNRCPVQETTTRLPSPLKTQIRHHRGHQALIRQLSLLLQDRPPEKKDMVAIHHTSLAINRQHAIGIPIKAKAHGGALLDHRSAQRLKVG